MCDCPGLKGSQQNQERPLGYGTLCELLRCKRGETFKSRKSTSFTRGGTCFTLRLSFRFHFLVLSYKYLQVLQPREPGNQLFRVHTLCSVGFAFVTIRRWAITLIVGTHREVWLAASFTDEVDVLLSRSKVIIQTKTRKLPLQCAVVSATLQPCSRRYAFLFSRV